MGIQGKQKRYIVEVLLLFSSSGFGLFYPVNTHWIVIDIARHGERGGGATGLTQGAVVTFTAEPLQVFDFVLTIVTEGLRIVPNIFQRPLTHVPFDEARCRGQ